MQPKKRFLFGNLVYYFNENEVLLLNLTSFRRQKITMDTLSKLINIEQKLASNNLTAKEKKLLREFYDTKQIFTLSLSTEVENSMRSIPKLDYVSFPVKAFTLNLTHSCNFSCTYCYQNAYKQSAMYRQFMTINDIEQIMNYLSQDLFFADNIEEIIISGGEPLLRQNINTINYIINNLKSKKFIMFTNGKNIDSYKSIIDFNLIDEYQISFDGTAEIIKGVNHNNEDGTFEKIISGIQYLDSLNKTITIVVMCTQELVSYLDEFLLILENNGLTNKSNIEIKFTLIKDYYSCDTISKEYVSLSSLIDFTKRINSKLTPTRKFVELYNEVSKLQSIVHRPLNQKQAVRVQRCDLTKSVPMVFEPSGEVFWCLCLGDQNGVIGHYKKGVCFDKEKVLQLGNRDVFHIDKCASCNLKYLCGGGCPLPLTSKESGFNQPVCGLYGLDEFWDKLEDFV